MHLTMIIKTLTPVIRPACESAAVAPNRDYEALKNRRRPHTRGAGLIAREIIA